MPNVTARASARTLSNANQHPDAAIFKLVEQVIAASKVLMEAVDTVEKAEERRQGCQNPPVVIRTERDRQLGLYVGNRAGTPYEREDIPALRALVRANSIIGDRMTLEAIEVWKRAVAILEALRDLIAEESREKVHSGIVEARRRQDAADDAYVALAEKLLKTRAETVDGVLAKARLMGRDSFSEEGIERRLHDNLCRLGPQEESFALSVARDLIQLTRADRAPAADGEARS